MKNKSQPRIQDEMLMKLQQLNLSSSSSDSFDSRIKQSLQTQQLKQQPQQQQLQQHQKNKQSIKQQQLQQLLQQSSSDQFYPLFFKGNSILSEIQSENEKRRQQQQHQQPTSNNTKKKNVDMNKENYLTNNTSNSYNNDSESCLSNRFQESASSFKRISERLKSQPNLKKKLLENSREEEEDPTKIYEKLKENISREITLNKQRNEQYLNEINLLQSELNELKLQEVKFEKDFYHQDHQFSIGNQVFTFNTIPNVDTQTQNQSYKPSLNNGVFQQQYQSPSYQVGHSDNILNRLNRKEVLSNPLQRSKVPLQFHSLSGLDNLSYSGYPSNKKRMNNRSMQLFQESNIQNQNGMGESQQFMSNENSCNNMFNLRAKHYQQNYNDLHNEQNQGNNTQSNGKKNKSSEEKLNIIINHANINSIIQQEQPSQLAPNTAVNAQEQPADQYWNYFQNRRTDQQFHNGVKYVDDSQNVSQENIDDYDNIKPIYNNYHPFFTNNYEESGKPSNQHSLYKQSSSHSQTKKSMNIKPLKLLSASTKQSPKKSSKNANKSGQEISYKSPLQNLKIKQQEQTPDGNFSSKATKKLKQIINPESQLMRQSKSEQTLKKKIASTKSLERYPENKSSHNVTQNSKVQTPHLSKKSSSKDLKSLKKAKALLEQPGTYHFSQVPNKKKDSSQLNSLQAKKMSNLSHTKVQTSLLDKQVLKKKNCPECLNLLRKNISTSYCTQHHGNAQN